MGKPDVESRLIINLAKGDAPSFDEIFDRYNERIYAFSLSSLKNSEDAEGVIQEVFLALWKDRAKLKDLKNLEAWIFKISFNLIRKRFRKLANERKHLDLYSETSESFDNGTITEVEYNDLLERAERIIETLPLHQRKVLLLSSKDGMSNQEISKKLNITKKTVENHLTNAKSFLTKALADEIMLSMVLTWLILK